jgi:glycosyltransferase involved in cell wall biosynthesis
VRIAIISPFIDRQHGTERAVAELLERLATHNHDEVHLYAQRVQDLTLADLQTVQKNGGILWHRVAKFPGPHLIGFLGWLFLNHLARWPLFSAGHSRPDIVFSPGINALDADVIQVHAMFHRLAELQSGSGRGGLRGLHRKLYYALVCNLERRIYGNRRIALAAVSQHTADQIARYFGRNDVTIIPYGVDHRRFSAAAIAPIRQSRRQDLGFSPAQLVLLLIGNDWRNKGLKSLLEALARCPDIPLQLVVVGQDEQAPFRADVQNLGLTGRVEFFAPVPDVRMFYAAADVLVAPSLEDSFNLPVLEAMSCGLPVIVSPRAGVSAWLTHLHDSVLLNEQENSDQLAAAIRQIARDPALRAAIAANASRTASKFSWDTHAADLRKLMVKAFEQKRAATITTD